MQLKENNNGFTRVNLYEQIADYLEKKILLSDDADLQEGARLPSEQELADQFSVSRNVIRESIKVLKERGLVDTRNGVGAYITSPNEQKISDMIYRYVLMRDIRPEDIYDVRRLIENYSASLAAQRITDEQLATMRDILAQMEDRSLSINQRRERDFEFHVLIAKSTGNSMLEIMVISLKDVLIAMMEKGIVVLGGIEDACVRHKAILEALEAHDSGRAVEAMTAHIDQSLRQVQFYEAQAAGGHGPDSSV